MKTNYPPGLPRCPSLAWIGHDQMAGCRPQGSKERAAPTISDQAWGRLAVGGENPLSRIPLGDETLTRFISKLP